MKNILKNWETLGAYFSAVKDDIPMEQRLDKVGFKFNHLLTQMLSENGI
jgi:hypothetical protein